MNDVLTIGEIKDRFDSEWVLIGDPQTDEALNVQAGRVLAHGRDRDEVYRQAVKLKSQRFATLFTGVVVPKGTAVVL